MTKKIQIIIILISSLLFFSCPYDPRGAIYYLDANVVFGTEKSNFNIDELISCTVELAPDFNKFSEYILDIYVSNDREKKFLLYGNFDIFDDNNLSNNVTHKSFLFNESNTDNTIYKSFFLKANETGNFRINISIYGHLKKQSLDQYKFYFAKPVQIE